VTITRDDWGVAHVAGKADADAGFGMIYAQAEDDFNRIETNYLVSLGGLAEAARGRPAKGEARRPDRPAARLGLSLGRGFDRDFAGRVLGRGALGGLGPAGEGCGLVGVGLHGRPRHRCAAARGARGG
jgi:hypothetical protein